MQYADVVEANYRSIVYANYPNLSKLRQNIQQSYNVQSTIKHSVTSLNSRFFTNTVKSLAEKLQVGLTFM